ncbi:MAG: sigma-54 dependent transcriptional regulator [Bacteroidota bacterium]
MANILLVEDDIAFAQILEGFLIKNKHSVEHKQTVKEALKLLLATHYDLILLDYRLPDGNGLELVEQLKSEQVRTPVIMMTSFHDVRTAVRAIRGGVFDYITKPVNPDELLMVLNEALSKKPEVVHVPEKKQVEFVKGSSIPALQLHEHIDLIAPTNMSVLVLGESGTGKEHVARKIHEQSPRKGKPFIAIDCGALSTELATSELFGHIKGSFTGAVQDKKGQFEAANGGTLFLDEIGNLSYEVQVKLLRVLQEKVVQPVGSNKHLKVDVRIIAATNDDLLKSVTDGMFREDLYHRVNEFKLKIPPLRERGTDLKEFVDFFIHKSNLELGRNVKGFSEEVIAIFKQYDWPGNLRELKNVVKRAVLLTKGEMAGVDALPEEMTSMNTSRKVIAAGTSDLKAIQETNEREMIVKTLQKVRFNKSKAAQLLNIDRKTLYLKMAKYQIE